MWPAARPRTPASRRSSERPRRPPCPSRARGPPSADRGPRRRPRGRREPGPRRAPARGPRSRHRYAGSAVRSGRARSARALRTRRSGREPPSPVPRASAERSGVPPLTLRRMDLRLSAADLELQRRARAFTDEGLIPLEDECEEHDGLSPESHAAAKRAVLDASFNAINHTAADGGQGHDLFEQMLIEEQWGRATGALWDIPWRPSIPLAVGTEEQKERYLRPACRGERRDAYAITEEVAGSDPTTVQTSAKHDGDGWVLTGEKWHVTSGDVADFFLVHTHVDGDPE